MRYLTIDEVLILHAYQIDKFGGNPKVIDIRLLESALVRPQTILSKKEMYTTVYDKAAVLAVGIISNHPFIDGNKRTGLHAMLVFLELNEIKLYINDKQLVKLGNEIATKNISLKEVAKFLKEKSSQH